jgi:serine/threonine protein kinase
MNSFAGSLSARQLYNGQVQASLPTPCPSVDPNPGFITSLSSFLVVPSLQTRVSRFSRITGGELFDRILDDGPLPEDEARKVVHTILTAVFNCHERDVIHRDIKARAPSFPPAHPLQPENVLCSGPSFSPFNIKLADFGLATYLPPGMDREK